MKIYRLSILGFLSFFLFANISFAQNIQTNTSSTTMGSTQFGFEPDPQFIEMVMELDTTAAGNLVCSARVAGVMDCSSASPNTNTGFIRTDGLPGSFTHSPIPGVIHGMVGTGPGRVPLPFLTGPRANFCGTGTFPANSDGCPGMIFLGGSFNPLITAPNSSARDFIGVLTNSVSFGTGATTAPNGFASFSIDSNLATENTTVDQFIESTVSLGGTQNMVFRQRDITLMDPAGTGFTTAIPDLLGTTQGDLDASLTGFTSSTNPEVLPFRINMLSRVTIDQDGAADPQGNFGGMNLDVQTRFISASLTNALGGFPNSGDFLTPGLNTGIDPNASSGFGLEWNGQAFP